MVATSHCGIDPMPWGIFSFLCANERFVDSKKNIPMQIWGERGGFLHRLLVSLVFYATFGCNCLLFYENYSNQYLSMGVATITWEKKNGTQVDKGVPFSNWILCRKMYTLITRVFFSLFVVLSSRWIGDPSTRGISQIWVVVKDKCNFFEELCFVFRTPPGSLCLNMAIYDFFAPQNMATSVHFLSIKSPLYPFVHFTLNLFLLPRGKFSPKKKIQTRLPWIMTFNLPNIVFKLGYRVHDFVDNEVQRLNDRRAKGTQDSKLCG